jgi:hypothetical protein
MIVRKDLGPYVLERIVRTLDDAFWLYEAACLLSFDHVPSSLNQLLHSGNYDIMLAAQLVRDAEDYYCSLGRFFSRFGRSQVLTEDELKLAYLRYAALRPASLKAVSAREQEPLLRQLQRSLGLLRAVPPPQPEEGQSTQSTGESEDSQNQGSTPSGDLSGPHRAREDPASTQQGDSTAAPAVPGLHTPSLSVEK